MQPTDDWKSQVANDANLVTYQLSILLERALSITVGQLGQFEFPAGRYLYTGSARRNIVSRVQRHLSKNKKLRWHIDYLLADEGANVLDVKLSDQPECAWNQQSDGVILVPGFGASDCRSRCGSHLKFLSP